jgi:hypothetical protein
MKIGIAYPIYCSNDIHFDFARQTLESIQSKEHELLFCGVINFTSKSDYDNYFRSKGTVLSNPENNVSMAWNRGIKTLLEQGCDYVIVPNLDIVFKSDCIDKLVACAEATKDINSLQDDGINLEFPLNIILWTAMPWNDLPTLEQATETQDIPETPHFSCFMVDSLKK